MGDFVCPHARDFSCAKRVVGWRCSVAQSRVREFRVPCAKRDLVSRPTRQLSQQLCSVVESDLHKWLVERVIVFS